MPSISLDHPFVVKHQERVSGVLSCFDRLIFRGYLPCSYPRGLEGFLHQHGVSPKDFNNYAPKIGERIKAHVLAEVKKAGAEYRFLPRQEKMEEQARQRVREQKITEGIVCAYGQMETCRTFRLVYGPARRQLRPDYRKCLVMYVYLMHAVLGLIHVKIHTWFPLVIQVYANGHDILAKKLDRLGVNYRLEDNAFTQIENLKAAQSSADRMSKLNWPQLLGELAQRFNPLVGREIRRQDYYWVMEQAEYATDVLFKKRSDLEGLYPRLVEHARACFTAEDVLKFLGRAMAKSFRGEVKSHVRRSWEGVRIKHQMKANKLKMYNKARTVLRIETTINDPKEFRVFRQKRSKDFAKTGTRGKKCFWLPLCRGVSWMWRWAEVSRQSNRRYLEALAVVDDDSQARRLVARVTQSSTKLGGRPKRGLQPLGAADQALFLAAMRGEHRLRGFRNQDLARHLYPHVPQDAGERRRRCARVTRLIQLLRAHGLVRKVPHERRYQITGDGELFMSAAIKVKEMHLPLCINQAA
jgi:hypothetical protein